MDYTNKMNTIIVNHTNNLNRDIDLLLMRSNLLGAYEHTNKFYHAAAFQVQTISTGREATRGMQDHCY